MTREERTSALANLRHVKRWNDKAGLADETIDTCIKALEQEPCEDWHEIPSNEMNLEQARQAVRDLRKCLLDNYLLPESGDAISRQVACDAIRKYKSVVSEPDAYDKAFDDGIDTAIAEIGHNVPPVTPQPKYEDIAKAFQFGMALGFGEKYDELDKVIDEIKKVITPQPKTGHWIFVDKAHEHAHCSECDYGNVDLVGGRPHNYCPNCGAKMVDLQAESKDK